MVDIRDKKYIFLLIVVPFVLGLVIATIFLLRKPKTIKIGILHSITGNLATSERSAIDATLLAIDEINASGGVLGCQLEPILADGQSSEESFRLLAHDLVTHHKVAAIFGCYTSSSRKAVKSVVEKYNNLLFYGNQFEGLEISKNVIYTGMTSNHNFPMIPWAIKNLGPKIFLVGSTIIDSDAFVEIVKQFAKKNDISVVGDFFIPLGSDDVDGAIDAIQASKPDVVINTIYGDTNVHFFKKLKERGITPEIIPTITITFSEELFDEIGLEYLVGHYLWWTYFQSIPTIENKLFLKKVADHFGVKKVVTDLMISEYFNVYLWAKAVEKAKSEKNVKKIIENLKGITLATPYGPLFIDENHYVERGGIMAKVSKTGECEILWQTDSLIPPVPFPTTSSQKEWDAYLSNRFKQWGNKWEQSV